MQAQSELYECVLKHITDFSENFTVSDKPLFRSMAAMCLGTMLLPNGEHAAFNPAWGAVLLPNGGHAAFNPAWGAVQVFTMQKISQSQQGRNLLLWDLVLDELLQSLLSARDLTEAEIKELQQDLLMVSDLTEAESNEMIAGLLEDP
jgi:hypothetical protein